MPRFTYLLSAGLLVVVGNLPRVGATATSGPDLGPSAPSELPRLVERPPAWQSGAPLGQPPGDEPPFVPDQVLVRLTVPFQQRLDIAKRGGLSATTFFAESVPALAGVEVRDVASFAVPHPASAVHRLTVAGGVNILALCRMLGRDKERIAYAEPNFIARLQVVPDDPYYSSTGTWGQSYADMWGTHAVNAEGAWDTTQGAGVIVAVIDTGVDYNHVDFHFDENDNGQRDMGEPYNIWVNPGEDLNSDGVIEPLEINGLDDDGNGYADDFHGWDFGTPDNDPMDVYGHGTFCAGLIAAVGNNGIGIVGVAPQATVMAIKAFNDSGSATAYTLTQGFYYAADNGASVLSNSWIIAQNQTTADGIAYARNHGCVVVAAAGNDGANAAMYLPAGGAGVVTVAGVDPDLQKSRGSNHGSVVDVCGPYEDVLSLRAAGTDIYGDGQHYVPPGDPNAPYYRGSGTSAACPFVAGVAALLRAVNPTLTETQVRRILSASAAAVSSPEYYIGTGLVDATAALGLAGTVSPIGAAITEPANDLEVTTTKVPLEIGGSALGVSYVLEYGPGYYPTAWSTISTGGYVSDGLLGTLVFTDEAGPYHLRLTVDDGALAAVEHSVFFAEPALHAGWPVNLGGATINFGGFILASTYTSTPYDSDGDGADEVFINSAIYTFGLRGDGTFLPGWPTEQGNSPSYGTNASMPGPAAADFDGDGQGEVLWTLRDWYSASVTVWSFNARNHDGNNVSGFPQHAPGATWDSNAFEVPFVVADLDGDGDLEAVAAHTLGNNAHYYRISAFDELGTRLFTRDFSSTTESAVSLDFGDVNGDGVKEIAVVSREAFQNADINLHVLDADGNSWPGYPVYLYHMSGTDSVAGTPFLADLDGDGDLEVVVGINGYQSKVRAYHHDGTPVAGWPIQIGSSNQLFEFCLGDITGDGAPELIALANYRPTQGLCRAYALNVATGATLPGWPFDVWAPNRGMPAIVDVDDDGRQDVCFVAEDGRLYAVAASGQSVPGFPKRMSYACRSGVSAGDVDGDGLFELITTSIAGAAYVWDLPTPACPSRTDWPMRHVNPRNTGVFSDRLPAGDLDGDYDVDADDFAPFSGCMGGPSVGWLAGCHAADLDCDADVDAVDFATFQADFSGPQ